MGPIDRDMRKSFAKALTALHVQTFHSDPAAVRVEFVIAEGETRYVRAFFSLL
jgi:phenylpyruvate tautomerase PptA (4-oxalocrotonate tautomerase family)